MLNFCFVVLHYMTAEDTIKCVESIEKLEENCSIVIIDNASNNGSIEEVEKQIGERSNIYVIKNQKNLGFSGGNNIGYKFAKEELHADFIAISNNDIVVDSDNFIQYCIDLYEEKKYCILGPDIESMADHGHQNPMAMSAEDTKKIKKEILRYEILLRLSRIGIYDFIKNRRDNNRESESGKLCSKMVENVQLHGAFLVFSPQFILKEEIAFRTGTFLYMEEAILFQYCKKKGYTTIFAPEIKVYHKEDSSTNFMFKATKQKREFVFKNMIQSLKVYLQVVNGRIN